MRRLVATADRTRSNWPRRLVLSKTVMTPDSVSEPVRGCGCGQQQQLCRSSRPPAWSIHGLIKCPVLHRGRHDARQFSKWAEMRARRAIEEDTGAVSGCSRIRLHWPSREVGATGWRVARNLNRPAFTAFRCKQSSRLSAILE
ncbi:unnamed protein product [Protopolystoma xenopodis]|uniref:Uncharacterized protein n=1 Tax=Protopolystoma xenopodis TaxID=117903 RepID=A0A3S5CKL9_9PLAT|nr:unnamed protein product [Protopolystoma xenopodis]